MNQNGGQEVTKYGKMKRKFGCLWVIIHLRGKMKKKMVIEAKKKKIGDKGKMKKKIGGIYLLCIHIYI